VAADARDPCEASNQFREIPFTSSGDAPQNVAYRYPFQLGSNIYYFPGPLAIRNITAFALRLLLILDKSVRARLRLLFLTR
jgi:hypothetical protein